MRACSASPAGNVEVREFMSNLLREIDKTIAVLESEIPANPASEKNERLEKRLQRSLAEYFNGLEKAMDWDAVERIYYRYVKE